MEKDTKKWGYPMAQHGYGQDWVQFPRTEIMSVEPQKKPPSYSMDYVNKHFRMHTHSCHEFALVTRGSSNVVTIEESIMAKAPFLIYSPANTLHMQVNDFKDGYYRVLFCCRDESFHCDLLSSEDTKTLTECKKVTLRLLSEYEQEIITSLCRVISQTDPLDEYTIKCVSSAILSHIARILRSNDRGVYIGVNNLKGRQYLGTLLKYISDHSDEKLSLDMLAQKFYISRTKLVRDFKEDVGKSVGEYILSVRIEKARNMLLAEHSIATVAQSCGFNTISYFIQCYKRVTGYTPSHYIDHIKKNPDALVHKLYGKQE